MLHGLSELVKNTTPGLNTIRPNMEETSRIFTEPIDPMGQIQFPMTQRGLSKSRSGETNQKIVLSLTPAAFLEEKAHLPFKIRTGPLR